jgi:hypothetical protein
MNRTLPLRHLASALLLGGVAAACSSSSTPVTSGANAVNGTLGGHTLVAVDAIALKGVYDASYPGIVTIYVGNVPNLCSLFQQMASSPHTQKANLLEFGFTLGQTVATSIVVDGTYGGSNTANELDATGWEYYDASCNATQSPGFSAATVTLTSAGPTFVGTFDVTFSGGDHVTGNFTAPLCDLGSAEAGAGTADAGSVCLP